MTNPTPIDINQSYNTSGSDVYLDPAEFAAAENRRAVLSADEIKTLLQDNQVKASRLSVFLQTSEHIGYAIAVFEALKTGQAIPGESVEQALLGLVSIDLKELYND